MESPSTSAGAYIFNLLVHSDVVSDLQCDSNRRPHFRTPFVFAFRWCVFVFPNSGGVLPLKIAGPQNRLCCLRCLDRAAGLGHLRTEQDMAIGRNALGGHCRQVANESSCETKPGLRLSVRASL